MTAFRPGDRVALTIEAPPNPAGTPGTITHARPGGTYGVALDHDAHHLPGTYTTNELARLPG